MTSECGAVPAAGITPREFSQALLGQLGLPVTENNTQAMVAACAIEGGHYHNAARYNPLNTTQPAPGSHAVTHVGVQAYDSWEHGLEATTKTLRNGYYGGILASLAADAPPDDTLHQMALSPWGWYHLVNGARIANPIGKASGYQPYGNTPDPMGGAGGGVSFGGGAGAAVVALLILVGGWLHYR